MPCLTEIRPKFPGYDDIPVQAFSKAESKTVKRFWNLYDSRSDQSYKRINSCWKTAEIKRWVVSASNVYLSYCFKGKYNLLPATAIPLMITFSSTLAFLDEKQISLSFTVSYNDWVRLTVNVRGKWFFCPEDVILESCHLPEVTH